MPSESAFFKGYFVKILCPFLWVYFDQSIWFLGAFAKSADKKVELITDPPIQLDAVFPAILDSLVRPWTHAPILPRKTLDPLTLYA